MPHELRLQLPPETNPETLDDAALLALAVERPRTDDAGAGAVPSIVAARLTHYALDARPRHMAWDIALTVFVDGDDVPPAPATTPEPLPAPSPSAPHVVIVGSGPAGLWAALTLIRRGLRVTVLERGPDVRARRRAIALLNRGRGTDPESNYCFGEGGAGTYSDGKVYTRSVKRGAVRDVLLDLVAHGAPPRILSSWRPHIGSNRLPRIVQSIRDAIRAAGCEVRFQTRADEIVVEDGRAVGVLVRATTLQEDATKQSPERERRGEPLPAGSHGPAEAQPPTHSVAGEPAHERLPADAAQPPGLGADSPVSGSEPQLIRADAVIVATGHSATDALRMLARAGATLEAKAFALGVRVEHPQGWLDDVQYRGQRKASNLPPAFYDVSANVHERGVFSFCMCPGGWVVPSQTTPGTLVVNGMSLSKRNSPFANSGLVVSIEPRDWCGTRGARWGFRDLLRNAAALSAHPLLHEVVTDPRGGAPINVADGRLPVHPAIDPLFGVRLQVALETIAHHSANGDAPTGRAPASRCDRFVAAEPAEDGDLLPSSFLPGLVARDFADILPRGVHRRLRLAMREIDRRLRGFAGEQGQIIGVETRTSSPVRVVRDKETFEAVGVRGLYPAGEGAGYAGGIVTAAVDGINIAEAVARRLTPAPRAYASDPI